MGDEVVVRLAKLRRAMVKMQRAGRTREFEAVSAAYAELKKSAMEQAEREHIEGARARRAAERAEAAREAPKRWKLPRGFGVSPLAAERARGPLPAPVPQIPNGGRGLRPWRGGHPAGEVIWRPGR